jgi:hypothetical protein
MTHEELKSLSYMSEALFPGSLAEGGSALRDTVGAISVLGVGGEKLEDRAAKALLERSSKMSSSFTSRKVHLPFFRFPPRERLVLIALNRSKWTFSRIGVLLDLPKEHVEEIAWRVRISLAASGGFSGVYPSQGVQKKPSCPDFNPFRPWTQRFLDQEISKMERMFLESHLLSCDYCKEALMRSRGVYYAADKHVPEVRDEDVNKITRELSVIFEKGAKLSNPVQQSVLYLVFSFFTRRDFWFFAIAMAIWIMILNIN